MFDPILRRFMEEAPVCVAVRATLQRLLRPEWLDELFCREARQQYQSQLLFSSLVGLMSQVICGTRRSLHEAYQHTQEIGVSITSVYNKLNGLEPPIGAALVRRSAAEAEAVMEHLPAPPSPLKGYEVRIVDGNHLAATQHRIEELRYTRSGPLPGQSLVVLDPQRRLMVDVVPAENAHAQERSLVGQLLPMVGPGQLWIADRNFCTTRMLTGVMRRGAVFLIRQHASTLTWETAGKFGAGRRIEGGRVCEQPIRILDPLTDRWIKLRRVKLELDEPTRDGEKVVYLLTNLPKRAASAAKAAELYKGRWQVESAFGELTASLQCEINTLGYPRAALFGFCLALLAYNAVSLVKTALAAAHGQEKVQQEVSFYQLAREVAVTYRGLELAVEDGQWAIFSQMQANEFARTLLDLAKGMDLRRYRKHPRGVKKKRPPQTHGRRIKHVATAKLLAQRTSGSAGP
jgi:IS4 transposase